MPSRLRTDSGTKISFFAFQDIITSVTGILILVTLIMTLYLNNDAPTATRATDSTAVRQRVIDTQAKNEDMRRTLDAAAAVPDPASLQARIEELQRQIAALTAQIEAESKQRPVVPDYGRVDLEKQIRQNFDRLEQMRRAAQEIQARIQEMLSQLKDQVVLIPEADTSGKRPVIAVIGGTKISTERPGAASARSELTGVGLDAQFANALKSFNAANEYIVFYVRPSGIELWLRCRELARRAGFTTGTDTVEETKEVVVASPP